MPHPDPSDRYDTIVRRIVSGSKWICASDVAVAAAREAKQLVELGGRAMGVAARRGTGEMTGGVCVIDLDVAPSASMAEGIRAGMAALRNLPKHVLEDLDGFDPDRRARVILPLFGDRSEIAGRRVFGARRPEWVALEDKTKIDAFWDAAGVPRPPSDVVRAALSGCGTAAGRPRGR